MKGVFMKTLLRSACVLSLLVSGSSFAVSELSFDGPKETYYDNGKKRAMQAVGNFDVFNFKGSALNDVAVPTFRNEIQGLDNQDNWPSTTPNTYFTHNYEPNNEVFNAGRQVVKGNFDNNPTPDLVVVGNSTLGVCYNYTGVCGAWSSGFELFSAAPGTEFWQEVPIAVAVADFTGEGQDDVAVISWGNTNSLSGALQGFVTVFKGNGAGGADPLSHATPLYQYQIGDGLPLSITAADADGDGKKDVLTGQTHLKSCDPGASEGAFLMSFLNTGASFTPNKSHVFKVNECTAPTGLITVDPDANGKADPIVTCYQKRGEQPAAAVAARFCPTVSGPVVIMKGEGNGIAFTREQTLEGFEFPANSTAADYNKDNILDLAVAEHIGKNIVTYSGKAAFQVNDPGNRISTTSFSPWNIQSHAMNNDTFTDIVVSTGKFFDIPKTPPTDVAQVVKDRFHYLAKVANRSLLTADTALYTNNADIFSEKIGAAVNVVERSFKKEGDVAKFRFAPEAAVKGYVQANLIVGDYDVAKVPPSYQNPIAVDVAEVQPTEGVLVLINNPLGVSIDDPNCDTKEVTYRCTAGEGKKVVSCNCSTADPAITCGPAAAVGDGQEWTGKVTIPDDNNTHTFTVTGTDNSATPKVVTAEFTVDLSNCPSGTGSCPAKPLVVTTWAWFPITVCPDPALQEAAPGKAIEWVVTSGPANIGFDDGSGMGTLTLDGACLTGTLGNPNEPNYIKEVRVDGYYSIKDFAENCPFTLIGKPIEFRGTGVTGCSLTAVGVGSGNAIGLAILAVMPLGAWALSRVRRRR